MKCNFINVNDNEEARPMTNAITLCQRNHRDGHQPKNWQDTLRGTPMYSAVSSLAQGSVTFSAVKPAKYGVDGTRRHGYSWESVSAYLLPKESPNVDPFDELRSSTRQLSF